MKSFLAFILTVACLFFFPVMLIISKWPDINPTEWGSVVTDNFKILDRIAGSGGSAANNWWVFLLFFGLSLLMVPISICGFLELFKEVIDTVKRTESTSAVIVESELEEVSDTDGNAYRPLIMYQFNKGPEIYTNTVGLSRVWDNNMEKHERTLKNYPKGKRITVYYDPDDYDNSSLKQLTRWNLAMYLVRFLSFSLLYIIDICLCGIPFVLFINSFIVNTVHIQLISGLIFFALLVSLFFWSKYYYRNID